MGVHEETVGEVAHVEVADHPPRTDSPEYKATHRWLMSQVAGGCFVCGGPVDLSHPDAPADAAALKLEDHHGGAITLRGVLVALNLFPLEWSQGYGADPATVARFVKQLNLVLRELGEPTYDQPITTVPEVMAYVDGRLNASLKLCSVHHRATQTQHTPDVNGHEGVGIHEIPAPIWFGQVTCAWASFDMWAGSTGTIAVSPHPSIPGQTIVQHVHPAHPVRGDDGQPLRVGHVLPASHPHSRAAHIGYAAAAWNVLGEAAAGARIHQETT